MAGTLIGLILVVISLGAEHAKSGDEERTRILVTPVLFHFASLLLIALTTTGTGLERDPSRCSWGDRMRRARLCGQSCPARQEADQGLGASFAHDIGATASVLLLVMVLRNSRAITLAIIGR
jgi:hypothetical protein